MVSEAHAAGAVAAEAETAPRTTTFDWRRRLARRVMITDFLALIWVVFGTQIVWLGLGPASLAFRAEQHFDSLSYWKFSAFLVVVWMWVLALNDSRSDRVMGAGNSEYVRIVNSSMLLFGGIAIIAFLARVDIARGYLLISLPTGIGVLVLVRWMWRQWLIAKRASGEYAARVLLVGSRDSVAQIARELRRNLGAGYAVVGACVVRPKPDEDIDGTPIVGDMSTITDAMAAVQADTLAVTSTGDLPPKRLKEISWELEAGKQHLVLAPSLTDIAGPRIHSRPIAGLPLLHVETPQFSRGQRVVKRTFDIVVAALLIILLSPVLLVVALAVRFTSPGPVFFSHERIGRRGAPFTMLKFRSMRIGSEHELQSLLRAQGTEQQPLFKVKNDPRITPIGRFIRKYSLDELPQFFNVLDGSMSLVGPRPQIAAEVALYSNAAKRRLLTRPGITGLWQVSGRSELAWEDAVKLDLYYVENWTLTGDIMILLRTIRAALRPGSTAI
ncbi:sugar transferase [Microbacterium horticulturae]|uniref:Sugar transferase n=1 Tax=Microbacterium horticulturae TaxID=3028316 RepID=A0ABY8BYS6_9MICO|nr:sugar transferase [Microbacterium sp. KACC 23027]WEG08160.1 sugar transferase [Microbacterium sp. KACC 23027]